MKVLVRALLIAATLAPAFGLAIDREALVERTYQPPKQGTVKQNANSGNVVIADNSAGAQNGNTKANGGFFGGDAIAVPIAVANGGDTKVSSGDAINKNKASGAKKVSQSANSGNYVESDNSAVAVNGNTKANGGLFGDAVAIPIAKANGGSTWVKSGDATNINGKRNYNKKQGSVKQNANSGNYVVSDNSGYAQNGDTESDGGLVAVAVPIAVGTGGITNVKSGNAGNLNKAASKKVVQNANSGNKVWSDNSGAAVNGDTKSGGGLVGVAIPVAVGTGGKTNVESGDAVNYNL